MKQFIVTFKQPIHIKQGDKTDRIIISAIRFIDIEEVIYFQSSECLDCDIFFLRENVLSIIPINETN